MADKRRAKKENFSNDDGFLSGTTAPYQEFEKAYKRLKRGLRKII